VTKIALRKPDSRVANGVAESHAELPGLLSRLLEDGSRVIELELQLLEEKLASSMMAMIDRGIAGLITLYASMIGGSCLLAALILLLHGWMPWWQCFAIGGVVTIVSGFIVNALIGGSSRPYERDKG
jgi:hypothetical protein